MSDEIDKLITRMVDCFNAAAMNKLQAFEGEDYCIDIDQEAESLKQAILSDREAYGERVWEAARETDKPCGVPFLDAFKYQTIKEWEGSNAPR